jgi:polysaccharide export outer membrane protein
MSIKNSVVFVCLLVSIAGCASVAPGIQFSKSRADVVGDDDHPRTEIISINSALVRKEKELRDRQVADDLSSLVSAPQPYVVEAGDVLQIVVWDHPELSASMLPAPAFGVQGGAGVAGSPMQPQSGFEVDPSGMLDFPYAGKLKVSGLTSSEIHLMLTTRLAHYLRQPKLSVRLLAYRSKRVYVDGEVKLPGVQAINDLPMTLTEAINRSGGMNPTADQSRITLNRAGKSYAINLPLLVQRGMNPSDILLKNGDVVRVLARDENKIFVSGEVSGPRALPMRNGRLTLNEALGEAGGINPVTGDARQVYVIRRSSSESRVYQLDANSPGALAIAESFELSPKDVVYVAATPLTNWNRSISALIPGALPGAVIAGTPGR